MKKNLIITMFAFLIALALVSANPIISPTVLDFTVAEGETSYFNVTYAPDNGNVTFNSNFTGFPSDDSYNVTVDSLVMYNNTFAQLWFYPNFNSAGIYDILLNVSDTNSSDLVILTLNVTNTNRVPSISSVPDKTVTAGFSSTLNLTGYASDADNDTLEYLASSADTAKADCTIAPNTHMLTITGIAAGSTTCNLTVKDAESQNSDEITVTVEAQDPKIGFTTTPVLPELTSFTTGNSVNFELVLTEQGNMPLTDVAVTFTQFVGVGNDVTLVNVDPITGISILEGATHAITMTASIGNDNFTAGTYTSNVTVSYNGTTTTGKVNVSVKAPDVAAMNLPTAVNLGSSTQERNITTTTHFDIENTGDYTLNNVDVSGSADSKYALLFSKDGTTFTATTGNFNIAANSNQTIHVKVTIPDDQTAKKTDIGYVKIESDEQNATISYLYLETKSMLDIKDLNVWTDGDKTSSVNNGETVDEVKPGDKVEFSIEVSNLFTDDMKIEDVEVEITIYDIDDNENMDETSDSEDIDENDEEDFDVDFTIPTMLDEGKYTVDIEVSGEDEEGGDHYKKWTIYLEVEKKSHEIIISEAELRTSVLQCIRSTTLDIELTNIGEDEEDEVKLIVSAPELGIDFTKINIDLEEGDDEDSQYKKSFTISVGDDFKAGNYPITVKAYYNTNVLDDEKQFTLEVKDCATNTATTPITTTGTDSSDIIVQTNMGSDLTPGTSGSIVTAAADTTTESSFTSSGVYISFLVLLNVVAIGGLVYLLIFLGLI